MHVGFLLEKNSGLLVITVTFNNFLLYQTTSSGIRFVLIFIFQMARPFVETAEEEVGLFPVTNIDIFFLIFVSFSGNNENTLFLISFFANQNNW